MKSVLISTQPKWCELIASGKKTVEVRKTAPKMETPFKCCIYQTKSLKDNTAYSYKTWARNGKVIGEFVCDRIYEAIPDYEPYLKKFFNYDFWDENGLLIDDCLSDEQKDNYAHGKILYGWHISDLKIYDKPKELGEFRKPCNDMNDPMYGNYCNECDEHCRINRPPQSWCYVEEQ